MGWGMPVRLCAPRSMSRDRPDASSSVPVDDALLLLEDRAEAPLLLLDLRDVVADVGLVPGEFPDRPGTLAVEGVLGRAENLAAGLPGSLGQRVCVIAI